MEKKPMNKRTQNKITQRGIENLKRSSSPQGENHNSTVL